MVDRNSSADSGRGRRGGRAWIKRLVVMVGGVVVIGIGAADLYVALSGDKPITVSIESLPLEADDDGERWVRVDGRLALDHAKYRVIHGSDGRVQTSYLDIPLVRGDWLASDPVSLVAAYGPFNQEELLEFNEWVRSADRHVIEGMLDGRVSATDRLAGHLVAAPGVLLLQPGSRRGGTGIGLLLLAVGVLLVLGPFVYRRLFDDGADVRRR